MPEIEGDLDSFAVDPRRYAPLKRFRCGTGESRPEREVDKMTREYAKGARRADLFRVTVEQPAKLLGLAAFQPAAFSQPVLAQVNGYPYISLIGVSREFRGCKKAGVRPGDVVLLDALRTINSHGQWGDAPDIFALVDPNNGPSCALFERHGFEVVIAADPSNPEADSLLGRQGNAVAG
jgi:ribosomal protein S18 acetylase RimI-like enzyme